jgi:quinol monooxygenase YgiN
VGKVATVKVVTRVVAQADKAEEVRDLLMSLVEPTRGEPGCLGYELLQNRGDPKDFAVIQEWESDAALEAHFDAEHFKAAARDLTQRIDQVPDIRRYETIG